MDESRPDGGWIRGRTSLPSSPSRRWGSELKCTPPSLRPLPRDPVNLQVLQAFVDCHEFANLNLVQALR